MERRGFALEGLEPRILLSADAAFPAMPDGLDSAAGPGSTHVEELLLPDENYPQSRSPESEPAPEDRFGDGLVDWDRDDPVIDWESGEETSLDPESDYVDGHLG